MRHPSLDALDRILSESTTALFSSCGVSLTPVRTTGARTPPTVAGIVRFTGEKLRGTVIVASTFRFFADCRPKEVRANVLVPERASDWLAIRDWAGELANQLLGGVARRLFAFNVVVQATAATAMSGPTLALPTPPTSETLPCLFRAGNEELMTRIDAVIDPKLTITRRSDAGAKEGDVIIF